MLATNMANITIPEWLGLMFVKYFCFSVVYLFSWEPHNDVTYSVHRDSRYSFLPDWYIKEITRSPE